MNEVEEKAITRLKQIQCSCEGNLYNFQAGAVLNLIEKQQREIEKYKYLYQKALDNTIKSDKENIQKEKIINLMVEYIGKEDVSEIFCDEKIECDENCQECVKQYFKKKISR